MANLQQTKGASSNSQRTMNNAEKYPKVVKLFSKLLSTFPKDVKTTNPQSNPASGKSSKDKSKQKNMASAGKSSKDKSKAKNKASAGNPSKPIQVGKSNPQEEQKPFEIDSPFEVSDPGQTANSILGYISYWASVFLSKGKRFSNDSNRKLFSKALVPMIEPAVFGEVSRILKLRECANWITFCRFLPKIKYSANELRREYLFFFCDIRKTIQEHVDNLTKEANQKQPSADGIKIQNKFEALLEGNEIYMSKVKPLIEYWLGEFIKYRFIKDNHEFAGKLMFLIPYTYLIQLKVQRLSTNWNQFLVEIAKLDSKTPEDLSKAASSIESDQMVQTNRSFFTSALLERPKSFLNYPYIMDGQLANLKDDYLVVTNVAIRINSDKSIRLSYRKIFYAFFNNREENHQFPDPDFRYSQQPHQDHHQQDDGKMKRQTIYNFICRWTERCKNTQFLTPLMFFSSLIIKLALIPVGYWDEQMVTNERLRAYKGFVEIGFDCDVSNDGADPKDQLKAFAQEWVDRLKPEFIAAAPDLAHFQIFLSKLNEKKPVEES